MVEVIVERCAALDVHKETVMACVRSPGSGSRRQQEVREFRTWASSLRELRGWLAARGDAGGDGGHRRVLAAGVGRVGVARRCRGAVGQRAACEEPAGPQDRRERRGWLAQLLECGLLRGSFVPPPVISRLRDLTRYRTRLVQDRAREVQRVQKVLETAGIKLESVVSDVMGKAARRMIDALVAGERDVEAMAEMALTRMRPKIPELQLALEGRFEDHHALMLSLHLGHIDQLTATIERLDEEVQRELDPFAEQVAVVVHDPRDRPTRRRGRDRRDRCRHGPLPDRRHLASWAGLCPGHHESAGKRRSGRARKGDAALRVALCEAAWSAARTRDTYLAAQFRRFSRRMGKRNEGKAIFAVAHTMIVIIWHVLNDHAPYDDLGADYFDRRHDSASRQRPSSTRSKSSDTRHPHPAA